MNADIFISASVTFIKGTPPRGREALKGRLGRGVPPKPLKSPNPAEYKSAVDRFVLLWQLTEIHWGKQLSEDLTTEEVSTVLIFFSRRHLSDHCDFREMILHYDNRENMIHAISALEDPGFF